MPAPQTNPDYGPAAGTMDRVPEPLLLELFDYCAGSSSATTGKNDWRIPSMVARQWATDGFAVIATNDFARRFGTTRRTICRALNRLTAAGIIREIGRTDEGKVMYAPCLERGPEWRAQSEVRGND